MRPIEIIAAKVNTEGHPIPQEALARLAVARIHAGQDEVFSFGKVVLTVWRDPAKPRTHLYSMDAGVGLLPALARFHRLVWKRLPQHKYLEAPIAEPTIQKIARRFGWWEAGKETSGHTLFILERPA